MHAQIDRCGFSRAWPSLIPRLSNLGMHAMHDLHVCLYFAFRFPEDFPTELIKKKKEGIACLEVLLEKQYLIFVYTTEWLFNVGLCKIKGISLLMCLAGSTDNKKSSVDCEVNILRQIRKTISFKPRIFFTRWVLAYTCQGQSKGNLVVVIKDCY